jgi:hypothetical protein
MPTTVTQLIHSSFRLIGAIASGETLETAELNDAFASLNQMIASWSDEQLSVFHIRMDTFSLTGAPSYTMGPAGVFSAARPTRVVAARASSGNHGRGLKLIDVNRWTQLLERGGAVNLPMKAYVDYAYPLATVYLWPVPLAGTVIELYTLQEYTSFPDIVSAPPPAPPTQPAHSFHPERQTFTISDSTGSFTIGPGGQLPKSRPARCDAIAASVSGYRNVLEIASADEWASLMEPSGQPIPLPLELYVEYSYPSVTLNVWPATSGTIDVHSLEQLTQFAAVTDTVDFPAGYEIALRYNFAVALLPEYPRSQADPSLPAQAQAFKASLMQLNASIHGSILQPGLTGPRVGNDSGEMDARRNL